MAAPEGGFVEGLAGGPPKKAVDAAHVAVRHELGFDKVDDTAATPLGGGQNTQTFTNNFMRRRVVGSELPDVPPAGSAELAEYRPGPTAPPQQSPGPT